MPTAATATATAASPLLTGAAIDTALEGADAVEVPMALRAVTVNVVVVPAGSAIVAEVAAATKGTAPLEVVTV
ncbi:MAG TPA: hypothetical protein VM307_01915 [Egibacteraceae bacterium]|nr:hypothetical protein [Egibacteraceae bacterium]